MLTPVASGNCEGIEATDEGVVPANLWAEPVPSERWGGWKPCHPAIPDPSGG